MLADTLYTASMHYSVSTDTSPDGYVIPIIILPLAVVCRDQTCKKWSLFLGSKLHNNVPKKLRQKVLYLATQKSFQASTNEENMPIYCKFEANVGLLRRFDGIFNNLCGKSPQMFLNLRIFRNVPRDLGSQDPSFLHICISIPILNTFN